MPAAARNAWLFLAAFAVVARAGFALGADPATPAVVMVLGADQEAAAAPAMAAIEAQLSDLEVDFRAARMPALPPSLRGQIAAAEELGRAPGVACVFWFDLAEDGAVYVHLRGGPGSGDRLLVRRLEPGPSSDHGRAEELAIIVRSSVAALLRGGRIGILVEDLPEAAPAPARVTAPAVAGEMVAPEDEPRPAWREGERLSLGLGWAYAGRGSTHPVQQGLWLGLGFRAVAGLSLEAGYSVLEPLSVRGDLAALRLRRHPVRLGLAWMFGIGRVRLGVGVHLVVEHARQEVEGLAPGMRAASDRNDVGLAIAPHLSVSIDVWRQLGVFVTAGADLPAAPVAYVAIRGERTEELIGAWPVQPFAMAGLRIVLW